MIKMYPDRAVPALLRVIGDLLAIAWSIGWVVLGWLIYKTVMGLQAIADGITSTGTTFNDWINSFRHAVPGGIPYLTQFLLDTANSLQKYSGDPLVSAGHQVHDAIFHLAIVLALVVAFPVAIAMYCVLLLSYTLMAADRYLFPVLAADVRKAFGFSLANTGLLATIFTLGLGVGGLPTGYLLTRFSRKAVSLTGIVIFSSATALTTMVPGFWTLLVCLAAQGIGMSMLATSMFALAASYFANHRSAAIGSVNFCYGIGGFLGPFIAGKLRQSYGTWHAPMIYFGLFGYVMVVLIAAAVRPWFSETHHAAQAKADSGGAESLANRNTMILTLLSLIHGLSMYGFLGLYPTFLREVMHYSPANAGKVIGFFGVGALASIPCGWIGDRYSPRWVVSGSLVSIAVLGYLFYQPSLSMPIRELLTFAYGVAGSAVLYVNLAGYHVKALRRSLSSRGSGMFVTSLYGGAAFGGYLLGGIAARSGWLVAGELQITLLSLVGAALALGLRPREMSL